jgi:hypothetical protein
MKLLAPIDNKQASSCCNFTEQWAAALCSRTLKASDVCRIWKQSSSARSGRERPSTTLHGAVVAVAPISSSPLWCCAELSLSCPLITPLCLRSRPLAMPVVPVLFGWWLDSIGQR